MSSDVLERARRFVEEGERQQAEKEAILARYQRVNIHGKVLVDGHHVFLEMLRDIKTFNRHVEEYPRFLRGIRNIWLDQDPVNMSEAIGHVVKSIQEIIPAEIAQRLTEPDKVCISSSVVAKDIKEEAFMYCAVDNHSDILIFDARMLSTANVIKKLEEKRGSACVEVLCTERVIA